MTIDSLLAPAAAAESPAPKDAASAAREFEALWIQEMLRSARPSDEGGDSTREMALDMADQQIARLLAASGGLGLGKLVSEGLAKKAASGVAAPPAR